MKMGFLNYFKRRKQARPDLVIGEPYGVEHVFHIGIDSSPQSMSTEFWSSQINKPTKSSKFESNKSLNSESLLID